METATEKRHWNSTEIKAMLQRQFGGGERSAVLFEVRSGTGASIVRSIDAVVMSLWPSLGLELSGMEIKVSRNDWQRELKQPAKASATFEYFDRWYLVAPRHVANMDEIPGPWGWMAPEGDKLVTLKKAPLNAEPKPIDRSFLASILRSQSKSDEKLIKEAVSQAVHRESERLRAVHKETVERDVSRRLGDIEVDAKLYRELRSKMGDAWGMLDSDEVVRAVGIIRRLGLNGAYGAISNLTRQVQSSAAQLEEALTVLRGDAPVQEAAE